MPTPSFSVYDQTQTATASETENIEILWMHTVHHICLPVGQACMFNTIQASKMTCERWQEAKLHYHHAGSEHLHCSSLFLHSFTSDTERYATNPKVMWVCPSACHSFFYVPFWSFGEEMKVAYAVVSESLWMMFPSSADIPRAPRNAAWPKRGGKRAVSDGCGWPASSLGLCRSIQLLIWFGSSLPSHTNEYSMVGTGAPTNVWSPLGWSLLCPVFEKY